MIETPTNPTNISENRVRAAVEEIVASDAFGVSVQLPALLKYLVNEELAGRGERLKAYSIAVDVLGRDEDFDPSIDSIVRVEMLRLRRALNAYKATDTRKSGIEIRFQKGSYRPQFDEALPSNSVGEQGEDRQGKRRFSFPRWAGFAIFAVLSVIGAISAYIAMLPNPDCDRPGLALKISGDLSRNADIIEGIFVNTLSSYPFVKYRRDVEECASAPTYILHLRTKPSKPHDLNAVLEESGVGIISSILTRKIKDVDDLDSIEISIAQILQDIAAGHGIIPKTSLAQPWNDETAKEQFRCDLSIKLYLIERPVPNAKDIWACAEQRHKDNSSFANVHSNYALLLQLSIRDAARFQPFSREEMQRRYRASLDRAYEINPLDPSALTASLREYRSERPPDLYNIQQILNVIEENHRNDPDMIGQAAMIYGYYFGQWDKSKQLIRRATLIDRSHAGYQLAELGNLVVRDQWDAAYERAQRHISIAHGVDAILFFVIGKRKGDEHMANTALKALNDYGLGTVSDIRDHLEATGFHPSIINALTSAADGYLPA